MVHKSFALSIGHAIGVSLKEWFYKGAKKAYVSNPYQIRIQITIVATLSGHTTRLIKPHNSQRIVIVLDEESLIFGQLISLIAHLHAQFHSSHTSAISLHSNSQQIFHSCTNCLSLVSKSQ